MPLEVTMTESSGSYLHEPDEWIAGEIVDIQTAPDTGYGPGFKWVIALDDQDEGDFDQWAFCSQILATRSKLYSWLAGLDPENVPTPGSKVDVAKYVGRRCQVMFERFDKDGLTREKIVKLRAEKAQTALQKKQAQAAAAKSPKRETTDFAGDEAPF